jgi:hypothetical protein
LGIGGDPRFTINEGTTTLGVSFVANIQVKNPNPLGLNFESIVATVRCDDDLCTIFLSAWAVLHRCCKCNYICVSSWRQKAHKYVANSKKKKKSEARVYDQGAQHGVLFLTRRSLTVTGAIMFYLCLI